MYLKFISSFEPTDINEYRQKVSWENLEASKQNCTKIFILRAS